jgi:hypothetical protein
MESKTTGSAPEAGAALFLVALTLWLQCGGIAALIARL